MDSLLNTTLAAAQRYLGSLDERPVAQNPKREALLEALGGALGEAGLAPEQVIEQLARAADPGLVASSGKRFFGFVVGGTLPAALASDWLVSTWDQNAAFYSSSPAAAVIEDVVSEWLLDLFGLPHGAAVGFVTGCQMANSMSLLAARHALLQRAGWNAARQGLNGAPRVRLLTSAEAHGTIDRALALLGFGTAAIERVACDSQGAMRADALRAALAASDELTLVCAQAGNVNTGAFDPFNEIGPLCREHGAWLHVDGAFGLWAAASPRLRTWTEGIEYADSWATDGHKWLNVPYDSGIVIVRDPAHLLGANDYSGDYLVRTQGEREGYAFTPESSRRARAIPIYAALRQLGRSGLAQLVERDCVLAQRAAQRLAAGGATILNDVVLNQVLFTFPARTDLDPLIAAIQADGTCWLGGTVWRGQRALRIAVSGWQTTQDDIDRSVAVILECAARTA